MGDAPRLEDLRAWHLILATCAACGRKTHLPIKLLEQGRPPDTRIADLEPKLCCRNCGNRHGNSLTISPAPRNI